MRRAYPCCLILPALAISGCTESSGDASIAARSEHRLSSTRTGAPLFDDLGDYHYPVTTRSPQAQRYFDQGLILTYAFNHSEVTVVDIRGDKVRLGITAPKEISVHRKEVYDAIRRENRAAAQVKPEDLSGLGKVAPKGAPPPGKEEKK